MRYAIQLTPGAVGRDAAARIALTAAIVVAEIAVEDADGVAIARATVQLGKQTRETNAAGLATFTVKPGRYPLTVTATGYTTQTSTETVA